MKRPAITFLVCLATLAGASVAAAQGNPQTRQGFWFSGGLGWGTLGCADCDGRTGGFSGGLSLGGTLSSKVLFGVGTTGWTKSEDGATLTVGTLDARVRFYPSAKAGFYLTGGAGVGSISAEMAGFGSDSEIGVSMLLGIGYDIRIGQMLSLTPYWHGFAVQAENVDSNVGQFGLAITLH